MKVNITLLTTITCAARMRRRPPPGGLAGASGVGMGEILRRGETAFGSGAGAGSGRLHKPRIINGSGGLTSATMGHRPFSREPPASALAGGSRLNGTRFSHDALPDDDPRPALRVGLRVQDELAHLPRHIALAED